MWKKTPSSVLGPHLAIVSVLILADRVFLTSVQNCMCLGWLVFKISVEIYIPIVTGSLSPTIAFRPDTPVNRYIHIMAILMLCQADTCILAGNIRYIYHIDLIFLSYNINIIMIKSFFIYKPGAWIHSNAFETHFRVSIQTTSLIGCTFTTKEI